MEWVNGKAAAAVQYRSTAERIKCLLANQIALAVRHYRHCHFIGREAFPSFSYRYFAAFPKSMGLRVVGRSSASSTATIKSLVPAQVAKGSVNVFPCYFRLLLLKYKCELVTNTLDDATCLTYELMMSCVG